MAIKPITNKQVVSEQGINRAEQKSTRNITNRSGNRSTSITPGKDLTKNYAITLKDVDTAILTHVKDVMKPIIREANETIKIPVMYGNEERWKTARKRGFIRDKQGAFILPLIMLKRTSLEKSTEMPFDFTHDVKRKNIEVVRSNQWSKKNRYDRFTVLQGVKPQEERLVTTMPNFVNITYEFVLWTNFIEQMNTLVESFTEQNYTYWGNSEEYKFLCTIDSIADASEVDVSGERFIKSTFSVLTKSYLLPEETNSIVTNKISNLQKKLTPSRVVFGYEIDLSGGKVDVPDKPRTPNKKLKEKKNISFRQKK
jgi:hypothetical protein